jgi:hypothetical protein
VGAAIAAGSHAQKGIWALLVKHPKINSTPAVSSFQIVEYQKILKSPNGNIKQIAKINSPSPSRLVKAVINPALKAFILE